MFGNKDQHAEVSASLHEHYDHMTVPRNLENRVTAILNAGPDREATQESFNLVPVDSRRARPGGQRVAVFAAVAAVAAILSVGVVLVRGHRNTPQAAQQSANIGGKSGIAACGSPSSSFAHFYIYDRYGDNAGAYSGIVQIGTAKVPTSSIFTSNGSAGTGYLCLSNTTGASKADPVQASLSAQGGPICYLGLIDSGQPWGGVDPSVTSDVISASGWPDDTYTVSSPDDHLLRAIGGGWHVFNSWSGFTGTGPLTLTVTAYTGSKVVDTRSIVTGTASSRQSAAPPTS